ncbi:MULTISPECIES: MgtC/SapB family protein [Oceanobacillus]|uniref:Cation transporter n=1 Tax=Oceanobacillus kimchii TaxID=746691 RepID=A0ABQ5TFE6_9BACI|nr:MULTISPECIES: MgtC/SapB family protein [Oceanobacillus]MBT2601353.1 MgtC/SapB family protein [Oceanobacillus sp. ISL-74]MBT2653416.1 MgtC/SapB family protein [Oceanobacillus sp. ISL-73]MCT1579222.1 MgtC/SapB family protein [Oceanobacillus kimchii]MCT2138022.1 MgtC/SapB family protein [Oceanobacillus kimchii]OEH53218.1 ATPase [Oceanobacillus sp. E9]
MTSLLEYLMGEDFLIIAGRLFIALILSGLIGFEREINNHSAGFRTHILVGVGSCLMMILSLFGFLNFMEMYDNVQFDPARIPSYVISGIGFLGAGTIIVYGGTIRGLTTAASIWTVAGIGLVIGAGMYSVAIVATLIILVSLIFLNQIENLFPKYKSSNFLEIIVSDGFHLSTAVEVIEKNHFTVKRVEIQTLEGGQRKIHVWTNLRKNKDLMNVFEEISSMDSVQNISKLN